MNAPPKISIVTPCCRPENLQKIYESIEFFSIHMWYIVYDTSKNRSYMKRYHGHPKITELECSDEGRAGHAQRNYAISLIEDGFVYFVDDDNSIHPDFWRVFPTLDTEFYYTWDQLRNKNGDDTDWELFTNENGKILKGNVLKLQYIDTAQIIVPRELIGELQWKEDDYKADGLFVESLYESHPSKHKYIERVLCYYNHLA